MMISRGVEISIAGGEGEKVRGGGEKVRGLSLGHFFFFLFFFFVIMRSLF